MAQASVKVDPADRAAVQAILAGVKRGYPKVMSRSLNAGVKTGRIESRREVQEEVTAKAKYVNRAFVENKATYRRLSASLVASGSPIPLIGYSTRQTKKGVSVKVLKSGGRKLIEGGFITSVKAHKKGGGFNEHKGVFVRVSKHKGTGKLPKGKPRKFKPQDKYRLPIRQLFGPSIPAIFDRGPILDKVERAASLKQQDELARQVELILAKS